MTAHVGRRSQLDWSAAIALALATAAAVTAAGAAATATGLAGGPTAGLLVAATALALAAVGVFLLRAPSPTRKPRGVGAELRAVVEAEAARLVTTGRAPSYRAALQQVADDAAARANRRYADGDHVGANADLAADLAARESIADLDRGRRS